MTTYDPKTDPKYTETFRHDPSFGPFIKWLQKQAPEVKRLSGNDQVELYVNTAFGGPIQ